MPSSPCAPPSCLCSSRSSGRSTPGLSSCTGRKTGCATSAGKFTSGRCNDTRSVCASSATTPNTACAGVCAAASDFTPLRSPRAASPAEGASFLVAFKGPGEVIKLTANGCAPSMLARSLACGARSPSRSVRRQERTKSCAVTGSPFDQRASARRWKVQRRPPSADSQPTAKRRPSTIPLLRSCRIVHSRHTFCWSRLLHLRVIPGSYSAD